MEEVYIVRSFGIIDCELFTNILGVYKNLEDAKKVMIQDIECIKETWREIIDFDDPERWIVATNEEFSYEGYTPNDDYTYEVCIEKMKVE